MTYKNCPQCGDCDCPENLVDAEAAQHMPGGPEATDPKRVELEEDVWDAYAGWRGYISIPSASRKDYAGVVNISIAAGYFERCAVRLATYLCTGKVE